MVKLNAQMRFQLVTLINVMIQRSSMFQVCARLSSLLPEPTRCRNNSLGAIYRNPLRHHTFRALDSSHDWPQQTCKVKTVRVCCRIDRAVCCSLTTRRTHSMHIAAHHSAMTMDVKAPLVIAFPTRTAPLPRPAAPKMRECACTTNELHLRRLRLCCRIFRVTQRITSRSHLTASITTLDNVLITFSLSSLISELTGSSYVSSRSKDVCAGSEARTSGLWTPCPSYSCASSTLMAPKMRSKFVADIFPPRLASTCYSIPFVRRAVTDMV